MTPDVSTAAASASVHARPPAVVAALSAVVGLLGPRYHGRALLRTLPFRHLARDWLSRNVVAHQRQRPDDVTVLIGVRNRTDHRLALALRSIREQDYPAALVHPMVVDYGSEPQAAAHCAAQCRDHGATYLRVETAGVWSRSRCLNVGLRHATTKFLLASDVDILFAPAYLRHAVQALRDAPLSVVCSRMLDMPETTADEVRRAGSHGAPLRFREWKGLCAPRLGWASHPSIAMTYTAYYHLIRGYDEAYELWGSEDADLFRRLTDLGLAHRVLDSDDAFYLHQWHPKYESLPVEGLAQVVERNRARWQRVHAVLRNDAAWGTAGVSRG